MHFEAAVGKHERAVVGNAPDERALALAKFVDGFQDAADGVVEGGEDGAEADLWIGFVRGRTVEGQVFVGGLPDWRFARFDIVRIDKVRRVER